MGLFSPREKKSVMEGGEQASIVEEVLFPSIRGGLANITGLVDLGLMTPTMAGRMLAKGENWRTALGRSAGLTTEALGLGAPPENTPEYFATSASAFITHCADSWLPNFALMLCSSICACVLIGERGSV